MTFTVNWKPRNMSAVGRLEKLVFTQSTSRRDPELTRVIYVGCERGTTWPPWLRFKQTSKQSIVCVQFYLPLVDFTPDFQRHLGLLADLLLVCFAGHCQRSSTARFSWSSSSVLYNIFWFCVSVTEYRCTVRGNIWLADVHWRWSRHPNSVYKYHR